MIFSLFSHVSVTGRLHCGAAPGGPSSGLRKCPRPSARHGCSGVGDGDGDGDRALLRVQPTLFVNGDGVSRILQAVAAPAHPSVGVRGPCERAPDLYRLLPMTAPAMRTSTNIACWITTATVRERCMAEQPLEVVSRHRRPALRRFAASCPPLARPATTAETRNLGRTSRRDRPEATVLRTLRGRPGYLWSLERESNSRPTHYESVPSPSGHHGMRHLAGVSWWLVRGDPPRSGRCCDTSWLKSWVNSSSVSLLAVHSEGAL